MSRLTGPRRTCVATAPTTVTTSPARRYVGLEREQGSFPAGVTDIGGSYLVPDYGVTWAEGPEGSMFWLERVTATSADGSVARWRVVDVVGLRGGTGRSETLEPPFVGRDDELRLVKELFHATQREQKARLVSTRRGVRGTESCGISSPGRTIGPATRCGKNVMKSRKSPRSYSQTTPRLASTK